MAFVAGHKLYLVGGAPRVGKSSLAQKLVETEGIPWLPTDIVRTVLRRVLPELDLIDQDPVNAARLAEFMYPHIEHAIEVCAEEAEQFLVEGFELSPTYLPRLRAAIGGVEIRACFLGNCTFSAELLGPPTAARNRSTRTRCRSRNSRKLQSGFDSGASSSAASAGTSDCPTSTLVNSGSSPHFARRAATWWRR